MFEELLSEEEAKRALEMEDMFVLPPWWNDHPNYPDAKPSTHGIYSSRDLPVVSSEETQTMLLRLLKTELNR